MTNVKELKRNVIFDNTDFEAMYEYAKESAQERLEKNDVSESEIYEEMNFLQEIDWDDFKCEMSEFLCGKTFVCRGTVGTWRGNMQGGKIIRSLDDMSGAWNGCDYITVYDEKGHLHIEAGHHDGTNYFELREITPKGEKYLESHEDDWNMSERELHDKLFNSSTYSCLPRYAQKVYGI